MRVVIIDRPIRTSYTRLNSDYSGIYSPVFNTPLLVRYIKNLKAQGIKQIDVLTEQIPPQELSSGDPWGVELSYSREFALSNVDGGQENLLILPGNVILDMDYSKFELWHVNAESNISRAAPFRADGSIPAQYFPPTLIRSKIMHSRITSKDSISPLALLNLCNRLHDRRFVVSLVENVGALISHQDYWNIHQSAMKSTLPSEAIQGFPLSDNLWVDLNTKVDKSIVVEGFAMVGKNSKINKNVTFRGFVIIGDNVIIDQDVIIEDSIIRSNTYVGTAIHVKNALVTQNSLYRADYNTMIKIEEPWLMGANKVTNSNGWSYKVTNDQAIWGVAAE